MTGSRSWPHWRQVPRLRLTKTSTASPKDRSLHPGQRMTRLPEGLYTYSGNSFFATNRPRVSASATRAFEGSPLIDALYPGGLEATSDEPPPSTAHCSSAHPPPATLRAATDHGKVARTDAFHAARRGRRQPGF